MIHHEATSRGHLSAVLLSQWSPVTGVVTDSHGGTIAAFDSFSYVVRDLDGIVSNAALVTVHITDGDLAIVDLSPDAAVLSRQPIRSASTGIWTATAPTTTSASRQAPARNPRRTRIPPSPA